MFLVFGKPFHLIQRPLPLWSCTPKWGTDCCFWGQNKFSNKREEEDCIRRFCQLLKLASKAHTVVKRRKLPPTYLLRSCLSYFKKNCFSPACYSFEYYKHCQSRSILVALRYFLEIYISDVYAYNFFQEVLNRYNIIVTD